MKEIGIVQGSAAQAISLVIGKDTVYVHTNITPLSQENRNYPVDGIYEYYEVQYDKDEYITLLSEKSSAQELQLINTQLALTELFESMEV